MIRQAQPRDAARIEELYRTLMPEEQGIEVLEERIAQLAGNPHQFLFVCEQEGVVAGTVMLVVGLDAMFGTRPFALLENVVVDAKWRSQGIGSELLAHAEAFCQSIGCTEVMLLCSVSREGAHRFYERHGYSAGIAKGYKKKLASPGCFS